MKGMDTLQDFLPLKCVVSLWYGLAIHPGHMFELFWRNKFDSSNFMNLQYIFDGFSKDWPNRWSDWAFCVCLALKINSNGNLERQLWMLSRGSIPFSNSKSAQERGSKTFLESISTCPSGTKSGLECWLETRNAQLMCPSAPHGIANHSTMTGWQGGSSWHIISLYFLQPNWLKLADQLWPSHVSW